MKRIFEELKEHAPFTFVATIIAVVCVVVIQLVFKKEIAFESFNIFHPLHIFVSAITSSAIFLRYRKNIFLSLFIGISASIFIGTLSDVLIPFFGGGIFLLQTAFYLPLIKEPIIVIAPAIIGSLIGIHFTQTKVSHFLHIFFSVFASLFYIISFSEGVTLLKMISVTIIAFVAVLIPCCTSDIVYPLLFVKNKVH